MRSLKKLTFLFKKKPKQLAKEVVVFDQDRNELNSGMDSLKALVSSEIDISPSKKILVLDLDETIIHADETKPNTKAFLVKFDYLHEEVKYYVTVRPGLLDFLKEMHKYFILTIFTTSDKIYAEAILTKIGARKYFDKILSRKDCLVTENRFLLKDLRILGADLSQVIFIDDLDRNIDSNPMNGLKITGFIGDEKDNELTNLKLFLNSLYSCPDVRPVGEKYQLFLAANSTSKIALTTECVQSSMESIADRDHQTMDLQEENIELLIPDELIAVEKIPDLVFTNVYPKRFLRCN